MPPTDLIILLLATWRTTSLFSSEEGPFGLFDRIRYRTGVRYTAASQPYGTNALARGLLCFWCSSVWFGALWAALYAICIIGGVPWLAMGLALPLALSGGAIALDSLISVENS